MSNIHPSAVIEPGASIDPSAKIGPFCTVGANVSLAANVELKSHVVVTGKTSVGEGTVIFPFAAIGEIPQDLKFDGEETRLEVGARNRIREGVTMNTGTAGGGGLTKVGDDCLFMTGAHVGIHQFVRIGRGAIIGAVTMVTNDVIPYGLVQAPRGDLDGLNYVGLKRAGVARSDITALRAAYQMLRQGDGAFQDRAARLREEADSAYVHEVVDFILGQSDRSFLTPR